MDFHENVLADDEITASEARSNTLSDYEIERNKPMPSLNHGSIQANLIALL